MRISKYISPLLALALITGELRGQEKPLFADGFETGDLSAWSLAPPTPATGACGPGSTPSSLLGGDLGQAPEGAFERISCLDVRNDLLIDRVGELAFSSIPLPENPGLRHLERLVVVDAEGHRVAAQFDVVSRWGGPPDDESRPVRWLQVSMPATVAARAASFYELRSYDDSHPASDPYAVRLEQQGSRVSVDTGVATFVLDPGNPALVHSIAIAEDDGDLGRSLVYSHSPGAGVRLVYRDVDSQRILSTLTPGDVSVDETGFEIVERGPVKAVFMLEGHFSDPGGGSLCEAGPVAYERFGFTIVLTLVRGSRDLGFEVLFRNECSDASGGSWTDNGATIVEASWELPFTTLGSVTRFYGAGEAAAALPGPAPLHVEQGRGGGAPWRRRARVLSGADVIEAAEFFSAPIVALGDSALLVTAQMPWMRYREPQALVVDGKTLSLRFVSDELRVGEGKGIWGRARVGLTPERLIEGATGGYLQSRRALEIAELERPLLVRSSLGDVNSSKVFPSLGTDVGSAVKSAYTNTMERLHDQTVRPGGAWDRGKIFGSQLWPEVLADPYAIGELGVDETDFPNSFSAAMNYWDPAGLELLEHLRSGDPRWVWDFALPAAWLQLHTAYLNIGRQAHGNRNGLAVTSGGPGCVLDDNTYQPEACTPDGTGGGDWHRSAYGSDDYTYDMGMDLAYVLRPSPALRRRFEQAGRTVVERYDLSREEQSTRELYVSQVDVTRQVLQHFEMLANCAEFVPGTAGRACHDRLLEVATELSEENLTAGPMCRGDVEPTAPGSTSSFCEPSRHFERRCSTPQQFMQSSLFYPFFHRLYRNYQESLSSRLRPALVEGPRALYEHGIEKTNDGVSMAVDGDWAPAMECSLSADGARVLECVVAPDSDSLCAMYAFSKPQTVALLAIAHETDPSIGLCRVIKNAYDNPGLVAAWEDNISNEAGWWKGAAQMMQSVAFGLGIYDTCVDR